MPKNVFAKLLQVIMEKFLRFPNGTPIPKMKKEKSKEKYDSAKGENLRKRTEVEKWNKSVSLT